MDRGLLKRALVPLRVLAVAVVLFFAGKALFRRISELDLESIEPGIVPLVAAGLFLFAVKVYSAVTFWLAVRSFGSHLPVGRVILARMAMLPARYVPGRLAAPGGLAILLRKYGVPGPAALGASVLPTVINLAVGLLVSVPLIWMETGGGSLRSAWPLLIPLVLFLLVLLHPSLFLRLVNSILSRMGRTTLPTPDGRYLLWIGLVSFTRYIFAGGVLYLLIISLGSTPVRLVPMIVSANAFSFIIGFIVFFVPAGIGVRESTVLVILGTHIPVIALAAVIFRLMDAVIDMVMGLTGFLSLRKTRTPSTSGTEDTPGGTGGMES